MVSFFSQKLKHWGVVSLKKYLKKKAFFPFKEFLSDKQIP